jgi:hypothetical protein
MDEDQIKIISYTQGLLIDEVNRMAQSYMEMNGLTEEDLRACASFRDTFQNVDADSGGEMQFLVKRDFYYLNTVIFSVFTHINEVGRMAVKSEWLNGAPQNNPSS